MARQPRITGLRFRPVMPGEQAEDWHRWVGVGLDVVPYPVEIRVNRTEDGRLACTGLQLGARLDIDPPQVETEITARSLRDLPISQILGAIARQLPAQPMAAEALGVNGVIQGPPLRRATRPRPGPRGWPREHFEEVARVYREGLAREPRAPVKYVRETMFTTEPTARRWIQRARDMGLLGKATPGKAGERPSEKATTDD